MNQPPHLRKGFSLVELLVSLSILSVLLVLLLGAVSAMSNLYINSDIKVQSVERGRSILELISREITPAVVDTRMQFVILPGEELTDAGAKDLVPHSSAALWMAPLGAGAELRCAGYFLSRNTDRKQYRLKRIYIKDDDPNDYFPRLVNRQDARDLSMRTSSTTAEWFTENWDEDAFDDISDNADKAIISTVSDGVVAFWLRALDSMGNPIPLLSEAKNHPASSLYFNSAAYFYMADGKAFDDGDSFVYLRKEPLTMKANRIPAEMEILVVMLADDFLIQDDFKIPDQENVVNSKGALDLEASLDLFLEKLAEQGIKNPEVLNTRVKLTNGG